MRTVALASYNIAGHYALLLEVECYAALKPASTLLVGRRSDMIYLIFNIFMILLSQLLASAVFFWM